MDEDAPSLTSALLMFSVIYVIIPLIMAYRRGYFFNACEKFYNFIKRFSRKEVVYPKDWAITKIRPLSKFEKAQIKKITVRHMPDNREGYWAEITLNSGHTLYYSLGDRKHYRMDDVMDKDNILLRSWHKKDDQPYNDIIPIE